MISFEQSEAYEQQSGLGETVEKKAYANAEEK